MVSKPSSYCHGISVTDLSWGTLRTAHPCGTKKSEGTSRSIAHRCDRSIDRSTSSSVDDDDDDDDASPERGVVARRRADGGGATDATDATDAMDAGRRGDDANERGHHG